MADYNVLIDTPENLTLEAEVAGMGGRGLAAIIDYLILSIVLIGFGILFVIAVGDSSAGEQWVLPVFILLQFALFTFYHLSFELLWNGQTPGKRFFGMRVVQANGLPLSTGGAFIRNFVRLVDFLPFLYGVGLITMFVTQHAQRLGDLAGRTIVIYDRPSLSLHSLRQETQVQFFYPTTRQTPTDDLDVRLLTPQDRRLVFDYMQRRFQFDRRDVIIVPLAQKIASQLQVERPNLHSPIEAEKFIEVVAYALNRQSEEG